MNNNAASDNWEIGLADLLTELSSVQTQLLDHLAEKRRMLVAGDTEGLAAGQSSEEEMTSRLQACLDRRAVLLDNAAQEGLPSSSLQALSKSLPRPQRQRLNQPFRDASSQARLLQHQSLTNWVIVQKTILHLSQLLEILATGGNTKPTYGSGPTAHESGSLVDQAA